MTPDRLKCSGCNVVCQPAECIELALGGMRSHLICKACGCDMQVVIAPSTTPDPMTQSTLDRRIAQSQKEQP